MDITTRLLSLLFSVYSPLYSMMAVFEWLFLRTRGRIVLMFLLVVGTVGISLWVPSYAQMATLWGVVVFICMVFGLQVAWAKAMKHYTLSLLVFYPLHPLLRSCVEHATGVQLQGDLYEVHVSPRLVKKLLNNPREIVRRTHDDSELITTQYIALGRPFSITGVTYTGAFGRVGYRVVNDLLQEVWRGPFVSRSGQKLLYPHKTWSSFLWINRSTSNSGS